MHYLQKQKEKNEESDSQLEIKKGFEKKNLFYELLILIYYLFIIIEKLLVLLFVGSNYK